MNDITEIYSVTQQGGELPFFAGRQYGTGWFRTIARMAFPILKKLGIIAANTASDVIIKDKKVIPTLKHYVQDAIGLNDSVPVPVSSRKRKRFGMKSINKRRKVTGTIFH